MKMMKLVIPVAVVTFGVVLSSSLSYGSAKIAKETGVKCVVCHTKMPGTKDNLNDAGKCYSDKKDLAGCKIEKPAK